MTTAWKIGGVYYTPEVIRTMEAEAAAAQTQNATLAAEVAALTRVLGHAISWADDLLADKGVEADARRRLTSPYRDVISAPSAAAEVLDRVRAEGFAQGVEAMRVKMISDTDMDKIEADAPAILALKGAPDA